MTNGAVKTGGRQIRRVMLAVVLTALLTTAGLMVGARTVIAGEAPWQSEIEFDIPAKNTTPKSEVVYANLSASGQVNDVYVVNILEPDQPGVVVDFGTYENVQNLTDAGGVVEEGDAIAVNVEGESLSYQGDMGAADLPWNISVAYTLDGAQVDPADLGGASGNLKITVKTSQNPEVDATYFENYLLQISVVLGQDVAHDIVAPDGQIAMAGSDTQVTFMAMPGKSGAFTVQAQVSDFEMAGMTFAAVPLSFAFDADTGDLVAGFSELASGVGTLSDGAGELASGVGQYADGAGQLADGADGLYAGLTAYQNALNAQAADLKQKAAALGLSDDLEQGLQAAIENYTAKYSAVYTAVYTNNLLASYNELLGQQQAGGPAPTEDDINRISAAAAQAAAAAVKADEGVEQAAATLGAYMQKAGLEGSASSLYGAAAGMSAQDPQTGESLLGGAESFAQGADEFASQGGQLASGAEDLAEGTESLYTEVQKMPDAVQQEIDAMLAEYDKSDYKPVSFTSSKNTNVELVQFVIATDPITAPEAEEEVVVEEEKTIIDRFFDLFR